MKKTEKTETLNKQLQEIDELREASKEGDILFSIKKWGAKTQLCIASLFGENSEYQKRFDSISYSPSVISLKDEDQHAFDAMGYRRGLNEAEKLLKEMIDQLLEAIQSEYLSETPKIDKHFSNQGIITKTPRTRIFISVPGDNGLQPDQLAIKKAFINLVNSVGFEPQEIGGSGDWSQVSWNFENVQSLLGRCQGAVILGLIRWDVWDAQNKYRFNSPYNHYEGALALAKHIPTFILMHEHIYPGGIAYKGGGQFIVNLPDLITPAWLFTDDFLSRFYKWVELVKSRRHVFLGYSSQAKSTAILVKNYLEQMGTLVMDWAVDFNPAHNIMDEIDRAAKSCLGGIFLFMKDDEIIVGDTKIASPRDNVIFEAGYFMHAKGVGKTLIVREEGSKMPADIGGQIYLLLKDRNDISSIEKDLARFIINNL